ncbi:MAG: hypothetical protein JO182_20055 [Acidobacteriaceae bacterium]|nr:hypothetical protein [Acidobacteriaceae bacterium]MBV9224715.1 hypothetical protein [Acidobacteriaceae bacterium]MBV9304718.1 hypothetical protein [Acidobacteriaceae bacterium]MBV9937183.1 hypothetical protein [Acidobacteriaceae bacterium]
MATSIQDQLTFVHKIATNQALMSSFLKDPAAAEKTAGVTLDDKLRTDVVHSLTQVNSHVGDLTKINPFQKEGGLKDPGQVMNAVLEAAAVVAAAAAVVTAATAVYNSVTKSLPAGIDQSHLSAASKAINTNLAKVGAQMAGKTFGG